VIAGWQRVRQVLRRHVCEPRGYFNCNGGGMAKDRRPLAPPALVSRSDV